MNEEDIKSRLLNKLDVVNLKSIYEGQERIAKNFIVVPYEIPKQCVATYFPEANVLIPIQNVARISNTPTSKSIIIQIENELSIL